MTRVIDTRTPSTPREVARLPAPSTPGSLAAAGDRLVIAGGTFTVEVFDVADPRRPWRVSRHASPGVEVAAAADGLAVLASDKSLYAIDLTADPPAYSDLARIPRWGDVMAIAVRRGRAYLAAGPAGVLIVETEGLDPAPEAPRPPGGP